MHVAPQLAAFLRRQPTAAPCRVISLRRLERLILGPGLHMGRATPFHTAATGRTANALRAGLGRQQSAERRQA